MTRIFGALTSSILWVTIAGCSSSDGGDAPAPTLDPTLTNVAKEALNSLNCSGPACHSLPFESGFAFSTKADLYAALVNQPAQGPKCGPQTDGGTTPYIRVVPNKPDESLLYLKINHIPPCGDSMPSTRQSLTPAQIALVHDWIAQGAKNN